VSIICECHQLDEETIISLVKQGVNTIEKLKDNTGAGCCGCLDNLDELIEEQRA